MIERTVFHEEVREALYHLYDYDRLRELQLIGWLGADPGFTGQRTLKQILTDAIESLKPGGDTPVNAPDWRVYQILLYRFVQCMTTQEVSNQLGLGERHFRRHQARSIERLAEFLWDRYMEKNEAGPGTKTGMETNPSESEVTSDLAWLQHEGALQQVRLHEVVAQVTRLLSPLARTKGVDFDVHLAPDLPLIRIHPQAMRQALVSTLSYVLDLAPTSQVQIEARTQARTLQISIRPCIDSLAPASPLSPGVEALAIPRQLLIMYNGRLQIGQAASGAPILTLQVPIAQRLPVMIVEDNVDTAELFSRHLEGSPYRPVIANSSREAIFLAQKVKPKAIVLDVMMPEQDGWETLILFKAHPLTETIPVIVATILTDRELALSLGAADFLHKPVSQDRLLSALGQVVQA